MKAGLWRCSCTVLRYRTCAMGQILRVARDWNKLASTAQLTLQLKDSLIVIAARNSWRQIIRHDAYTSLRSHCQRRRFQHFLHAACRKKPYSRAVEGLLRPLGSEAILGRIQIAGLDSGL